jgi:hypothetical protein
MTSSPIPAVKKNPNPIGPGLLSFLTFWPSVIMMAVGIGNVKRLNRNR